MENQASHWSVPSLTRHKSYIIALTAVALGCSLYYIKEQWSFTGSSNTVPRRSNAQRRPRRSSSRVRIYYELQPNLSRYLNDVPWNTSSITLDFLESVAADEEIFAQHVYISRQGRSYSFPLRRHMPSAEFLAGLTADPNEAVLLRDELEDAFLSLYFWRHLPPSTMAEEDKGIITNALATHGGFSIDNTASVLSRHQDSLLTKSVEQWVHLQSRRIREIASAPRNGVETQTANPLSMEIPGRHDLPADNDSEHSWRGEHETEDKNDPSKEGHSLLNLLYHIAEEQAKHEGYVHRRVTCDACHTMPIRGIRYHCANCLDYDLCEQCEAQQIHLKTHVFYKIRIPAPFNRHPRQPEPLMYPGKPMKVSQNLPKWLVTELCENTGYQSAEVEALWEQFRCLAGTEWPTDPDQYYLAINRHDFNKCFLPRASDRPPPPNLIYDRMFSFYDKDGDGLIGFKEFIHGLASLNRKNVEERLRQIFKAYDINDDGFVDRKDFLRMLRAYYAVNKELTRDVLAGIEDEVSVSGSRDIVLGSQPLSSAFSGSIPGGERLRAGVGKVQDSFGDAQTIDGMGAIDEREHDVEDPDNIIAEFAESGTFSPEDKVKVRCASLYNEPWPSNSIIMRDVEKVLKSPISPALVTSLEDQAAIRRVAHARIAREHQQRIYVGKRAVRKRKVRETFYAIKEQSSAPPASLALKRRQITDPSPDDTARTRRLKRLKNAGHADEFYKRLGQKIEEFKWPVVESSYDLAVEIGSMIWLDWAEIDIVVALAGYCSGAEEAIQFVSSASEDLEEMTKRFALEPPFQEAAESLPSSTRRSRSSSKVRFQDDFGTDDEHESRSGATSVSSRSIPVNERWGGFEIPEPEIDVGREVLYQVTQEAFNELLDPIFRFREDMALSAMCNKGLRARFRVDIAAAVPEAREIKRCLDIYQKRWRLDKQEFTQAIHLQVDENEKFSRFIQDYDEGKADPLTPERCSKCLAAGQETWFSLSHNFCRKCKNPSKYSVHDRLLDEPTPEEACPHCAANGKESIIGGWPHAICCVECGQASAQYLAENARLNDIVHGRRSPPNAYSRTIIAEPMTNYTSNQESRSPPSPAPALDLDASVAVFDEADLPSLERTIAQKPLNDLLAESGYARMTDTRSASPPPDPTLPQNRPNTVVPEAPTASEDPSNDSDTRLDPTLPQNRPDTCVEPLADKNSKTRVATRDVPETTLQTPRKVDFQDEKPPRLLLRYFAALDLIEAEDKDRGGAGRLNFREWREIMKGDKGPSLAFLGSWIELASF